MIPQKTSTEVRSAPHESRLVLEVPAAKTARPRAGVPGALLALSPADRAGVLEGRSSEAGSMNPEADGKRIFDIPGAAEYLKSLGFTGASVSSVRNLISSAQVPHIKYG